MSNKMDDSRDSVVKSSPPQTPKAIPLPVIGSNVPTARMRPPQMGVEPPSGTGQSRLQVPGHQPADTNDTDIDYAQYLRSSPLRPSPGNASTSVDAVSEEDKYIQNFFNSLLQPQSLRATDVRRIQQERSIHAQRAMLGANERQRMTMMSNQAANSAYVNPTQLERVRQSTQALQQQTMRMSDSINRSQQEQNAIEVENAQRKFLENHPEASANVIKRKAAHEAYVQKWKGQIVQLVSKNTDRLNKACAEVSKQHPDWTVEQVKKHAFDQACKKAWADLTKPRITPELYSQFCSLGPKHIDYLNPNIDDKTRDAYIEKLRAVKEVFTTEFHGTEQWQRAACTLKNLGKDIEKKQIKEQENGRQQEQPRLTASLPSVNLLGSNTAQQRYQQQQHEVHAQQDVMARPEWVSRIDTTRSDPVSGLGVHFQGHSSVREMLEDYAVDKLARPPPRVQGDPRVQAMAYYLDLTNNGGYHHYMYPPASYHTVQVGKHVMTSIGDIQFQDYGPTSSSSRGKSIVSASVGVGDVEMDGIQATAQEEGDTAEEEEGIDWLAMGASGNPGDSTRSYRIPKAKETGPITLSSPSTFGLSIERGADMIADDPASSLDAWSKQHRIEDDDEEELTLENMF
ncbi:hypothetical protein EJ08DRAFT_100750 [Tothia fuscella]|uniref:Uncharacterized protein n=1 Tax=Tothia fuscella TaxID=1048955 RepID=A0A9P4NWH2_9PEZI|nr:hypothetical protein EJ08DRAFT_100750 [Tothia fuscella]